MDFLRRCTIVLLIHFKTITSPRLICAAISPSFVRPSIVNLILVAFPIGWLSSNIIFMLLFCEVIFSVGVLVYHWGDPVEKKCNDGGTSSWMLKEQNLVRKRYYSQY